jgi:feruloyl esterase
VPPPPQPEGAAAPSRGAGRAGGRGPAAIENLPAFCRVAGSIKNHPTSNIKFELWLPIDNANRRFAQVGNGGFAGNISYAALATRVREGYAAASTDDGTSPNSDKSFLADLERIADFKGRAVVLTTASTKALFERFYSAQPMYSYFVGCSTGGLEALAAAQREPEQFDGIVGGDPAFNSAGLFTQAIWTSKYYHKVSSKVELIHKAVLAKCDATDDGVEDGVVGNPEKCDFDPGVLACPAGTDQPNCLTPEQVDAARKIYEGPVNPANGRKTGEEYAPGMPRGSELIWAGSVGQANGTSQPWYGQLLYGQPTFDMASFDFGSDVAKVLAITKPYGAQVTNPDLTKLKARGGKLILYSGWNDPLWSGGDIVRYYKEVTAKQGSAKTTDFARLFMMPGMGHCGGGDGPNVFDNFTPLVNWVENGRAPDAIVATKYMNNAQAQGIERTRPVCAYPGVAKWKGTGDPTKAENFACVMP